MARLIINADLTVLSTKVVKTLANRSCGTEDIASRCCTTRDSIRQILHRLKKRQLIEHDGRRPRTWKLKEAGDGACVANSPFAENKAKLPWSVEDERKLRTMFWAGATYEKMAETLGRTTSAIQNKCYELNLSYQLAEALNGPEAA